MSSFSHRHFLFPTIAFFLLVLSFEFYQFDIPIADFVYQSGEGWKLKENFITEKIIHRYGANLIIVFEVACLLVIVWSFCQEKYRHLKVPFSYLFLSTLSSVGTIAILKTITHVDCPWSLERYAGQYPYIEIFVSHPDSFPLGQCFPSGHAGSAFAWMSLYYFFILMNKPQYKVCGFTIGLGLGLIYGISQQLRGAHFFSHDIWSIGICWLSASVFFVFFTRAQFTRRSRWRRWASEAFNRHSG